MGVALADSLNPKDFSIGIVESNSHASFSKRHLSIIKKFKFFKEARCLGKNISECISLRKNKVWDKRVLGI